MPDDVPFYLPRNDEHTAVVGRNGTGKTALGAYLLATKNLAKETWIVLDYKGEEIFAALTKARSITLNDVPQEPGLFIISLRPDLEDETEEWLWKIWGHNNIGVYVDEGYMLPNIDKGAYQALLTQGRSKRNPTITLTQRPVKISPFVFSEASHVVVFDLNAKHDRKTVEDRTGEGFMSWLPSEYALTGLPRYHARWYGVKTDSRWIATPVPEPKKIVKLLDDQLKPVRRFLGPLRFWG
jgi:Type IV secretion-system coupling protein DNA-binding domain